MIYYVGITFYRVVAGTEYRFGLFAISNIRVTINIRSLGVFVHGSIENLSNC